MKYVLIVSCSKAKDDHPIPMPAIDRYDGPAFRVIRKAQREGYWPDDVRLLIVSTEFGLLTAEMPIPWYDRKMTPARATALQGDIAGALDEHLVGADGVFLNVAGPYHTALAGSTVLVDLHEAGCVREATGRIGERLAQMKHWIQQSYERDA